MAEPSINPIFVASPIALSHADFMDCRKRTDELAERMAGRFKQAPPNRGSYKQPHIHGTHVPVEEPSTASKAH
jgi:hypothetical protein